LNEPSVEPEKARAIIEAVLLTAVDPVSPGRLVDLLDGLNGRDIRQAIDSLNEQYIRSGHGIAVVEVANGFQLATRQELAPWVRKFHRDRSQVRLTQAALETLAIVAFKQPLTRVEVDSIRGVNSTGVLQTLMEHNMVRIVGRSDGIGKPMLFGTTREFLIHFGLRSLADLPKPKELEELLAEGARQDGNREQLALALQEEDPDAPVPESADPADGLLEDADAPDAEAGNADAVDAAASDGAPTAETDSAEAEDESAEEASPEDVEDEPAAGAAPDEAPAAGTEAADASAPEDMEEAQEADAEPQPEPDTPS